MRVVGECVNNPTDERAQRLKGVNLQVEEELRAYRSVRDELQPSPVTVYGVLIFIAGTLVFIVSIFI